MSKPIPLPKLHSTSGRAYVYHGGKYHYFGKFGTPQADERYWRWRTGLTAGRPVARHEVIGCLVADLFGLYRKAHPDHTASRARHSALNVLTAALGPLAGLQANEYGPLAFQEHRDRLLSSGTRCARQVNDLMQFVQRLFRWGVSKQLVPLEVWTMLKTVERLKPHESVKATTRRKPVPASVVAATLPHLSPHCADMVRLIVATGARPGEILSLRADEIVKGYQARPGWWYADKVKHKTSYKGKRKWLELPPDVHPILLARWPAEGGFFFPVAKPRKGKALHYQVSSLRQHIAHVCAANELPHWFPYQLRHLSLTDLAGKEGVDAARKTAGHGSDVIYTYLHEPPKRSA
jgi:integrase